MAQGYLPQPFIVVGPEHVACQSSTRPGLIEYWSWLLSPIEALITSGKRFAPGYNMAFGPGGIIEQEDSYAWRLQYEGSAIHYLE